MIIFSLTVVARIVPNPALVPGFLCLFVFAGSWGVVQKENPPAHSACGSLGELGALFCEYRPQHLKEGEKMFFSSYLSARFVPIAGLTAEFFQYFCWDA
ncbi:MAG: hypothetical protein M1133_10315 [Armatimonadetes bacterium]|nr:hypothetical protein [Armatimonadota bacterium]